MAEGDVASWALTLRLGGTGRAEAAVALWSHALKEGADGGKVFMTEEQQEWTNTKNFVMKLKGKRKIFPPKGGFGKTMWDIMTIEKPVSFDAFIMFCICANSLVMAMEYHGMSDG